MSLLYSVMVLKAMKNCLKKNCLEKHFCQKKNLWKKFFEVRKFSKVPKFRNVPKFMWKAILHFGHKLLRSETLRYLSAIWDWVGSLSLGQSGRCDEHWPFRPTPNGHRPLETGGQLRLLQRLISNNQWSPYYRVNLNTAFGSTDFKMGIRSREAMSQLKSVLVGKQWHSLIIYYEPDFV